MTAVYRYNYYCVTKFGKNRRLRNSIRVLRETLFAFPRRVPNFPERIDVRRNNIEKRVKTCSEMKVIGPNANRWVTLIETEREDITAWNVYYGVYVVIDCYVLYDQ